MQPRLNTNEYFINFCTISPEGKIAEVGGAEGFSFKVESRNEFLHGADVVAEVVGAVEAAQVFAAVLHLEVEDQSSAQGGHRDEHQQLEDVPGFVEAGGHHPHSAHRLLSGHLVHPGHLCLQMRPSARPHCVSCFLFSLTQRLSPRDISGGPR